jgi:hypothetical protein
MCELRSPIPGDPTKCFEVNPANACAAAQAAFELAEDVVRDLDMIPLVKVNIDDAIPNRKSSGITGR